MKTRLYLLLSDSLTKSSRLSLEEAIELLVKDDNGWYGCDTPDKAGQVLLTIESGTVFNVGFSGFFPIVLTVFDVVIED